MTLQQLTDIKAVPLRGGAVTVREKALLPFGAFSDIQNLRAKHPGFDIRKGMAKKHSTADPNPGNGVNKTLSLYQFSKGKRTERHFFAQMSDNDVLEATDAPPTVTTGAFGSEVFDGTANSIPASWGNINDLMLFSNGVDQHQIYAGTDNYISGFIVYSEQDIAPNVPEKGVDFTIQATDGLTSTVVVLDSFGPTALANNITGITKATPGVVSSVAHGLAIGDLAYFSGLNEMTELNGTYQTVSAVGSADLFSINDTSDYGAAETTGGACGFNACNAVFICTPVPASRLTFTVSAANSTASVATLYYRKNDNSWTDTGMTDGTISSAKTFGQTGSMTWTAPGPTNEVPMFMFGKSGYWYQLRVTIALDVEVEITHITYGSGFQDIVNVWDGQLDYAIEARFFDNTNDTYFLYATASIEISSMVSSAGDTEDRVYFNSFDNLMGVYVDVGSTPNTSSTTTIGGVKAWTGAGWTTVGTITDGTNGLANSGWITWARLTTAEPSQFQTSRYYSHWFYFYVSTANVSADVLISIETWPYFDISELGISQTNCVWGDRAVYSFDRYGQYIYISPRDNPLALNGSDYGILEAGDGRSNEVVCQRTFHNELMVWQEEKGKEGGCLTLFEGYSPTTFGKLVISTRIGTFNAKSAVVVDGVLTSTATEEKIKTLAFFLSNKGVCASDGKTVTIISDDIQNYFDPTSSDCIRRGYEKEMWLEYDSSTNEIIVALVTGTSATTPNTFWAFDLIDKVWLRRAYGQNLSCMTEVEAASGDIPILQYGGGTDDGGIYQLNTGTDDVDIGGTTTPINPYVVLEFGGYGEYITLRELLLRVKAQTGNLSLTITQNAIAAISDKALSMAAETATQIIRRHRIPLNITDQLISVKIENDSAGEGLYLLDLGLKVFLWKDR